jgi:hypothetical protein
MRKLHLVIISLLLLSRSVVAQAEQPERVEKSVSTIEQERVLHQYLMRIKSNDPRVNANELNKKLKELGLPTVDVNSPSFRFKVSKANGSGGSEIVGAEIRDGKNRFCLPCQTGWNEFASGIAAVETPEQIFAKNKELVAKTLGSCEYDKNETAILELKAQSCSAETLYVCQMKANCVRKAEGKVETTSVSASCMSPSGSCPKDPTDCIATRSLVTASAGADAIGDEAFPKRAEEAAQVPKRKAK